MERLNIATLWREVALLAPGPLLRASGNLLDREHGFDRLPQPGFVGRHYAKGGLLILGLNPAAGVDGISPDDLRQYKLLKVLMEATDANVVAAFEELITHLGRFMPRWKIIENNGINSILKAHQLSFDEVAYLNVCKWRTKSSNLSVGVKAENWCETKAQLALLEPGRILVLGKGLWSWYSRYGQARHTDAYIPRMRGDQALAPEAIPIVERLKREPLLPSPIVAE